MLRFDEGLDLAQANFIKNPIISFGSYKMFEIIYPYYVSSEREETIN